VLTRAATAIIVTRIKTIVAAAMSITSRRLQSRG
jgi:hypothetical protein